MFSEADEVDEAAWALLNQPELQRLRRIRQLGVSEFVFPSATHTRFAHSIGVFNNARKLIKLIERELKEKRAEGTFDEHRATVALMAALLHDIGHGPFSHAFEEARKAISGTKIKNHEAYTADMIEASDSEIASILSSVGVNAQEVANLLRAENPEDIYHAVVSSSFDADRLDYLQRDRYMTGTGSGAIDFGWLMDNVRVAEIDVSPPEDGNNQGIYTHSFCLNHKARDAAEDFLLARYRLYTNVYFHKTTRGIEQLVSAFFQSIAKKVSDRGRVPGLPDQHPIVAYFSKGGETTGNYRSLDDAVILGAMEQIAYRGESPERELALRFLTRSKCHCIDVQNKFPEKIEEQRRLKHALDRRFKNSIGETVFYDVAKLSIYGEIGADDSRAQKRLMIQLPDRGLREITNFSDTMVAASNRQRVFERYYFLNESEYKAADSLASEIRGRSW